jgi:hypothetical protein
VFAIMWTPAAAQLSQKWGWCVNQGDAFSTDQRINGCSSIIQTGRETGRNLALAYYSRGLAYYDKGDDDRAVLFSQATTSRTIGISYTTHSSSL